MATLVPTVATAQSGPLAPRNECTAPTGLAQLDASLRSVAATRDVAGLLEIVADSVKLDFGGGEGKHELEQRLASSDYRLWDQLDALLKLGCGRTLSAGEYYYASWPWYFSKDLIPLDPYEAYIVTGSGVRLRTAPSLFAPINGSVSWDYVRAIGYSEETEEAPGFFRVETRSGQRGYISTDYLRSLVDYRLVAEEAGGEWKVTAFIAGD
ncbi:MAG: SH3 domain-containing protein [Pseudomonadota bacterium]